MALDPYRCVYCRVYWQPDAGGLTRNGLGHPVCVDRAACRARQRVDDRLDELIPTNPKEDEPCPPLPFKLF